MEGCHILPVPIPMIQIPDGPIAPSVSNLNGNNSFVQLWKSTGIQQLIPNSGFNQIHKICTKSNEHKNNVVSVIRVMWYLSVTYKMVLL